MMADDLLRQFARTGSDDAFRALVERHSALVFRTALRVLGDDRAAAQDVGQEVFWLVARKAETLAGCACLESWLHRQTYRRALNHRRQETRRRGREQVAAERLREGAPFPLSGGLSEVDRALLALPEGERTGLILRFFEGRDYRAIGQALGIAEEAARKRVGRALEKLARALKRQDLDAPALGSLLVAAGEAPLPHAFADRWTADALASQASSASPLFSFLRPLLAGFCLTSLVAAAVHWLPGRLGSGTERDGSGPEEIPRKRSATSHDKGREDFLARIQTVRAGPDHLETSLRLEALLAAIPLAEIPGVLGEGMRRLSHEDRLVAYEPLLERWVDADPGAAMALVLREKLGTDLDGRQGNPLLQRLYERWLAHDRAQAGAWLVANWRDPELTTAAFQDELRLGLARSHAEALLIRQGAGEAFAFIAQLPAGAGQRAALESLAGGSPWNLAWIDQPVERRMDFYAQLRQWPDAARRAEVGRLFWRTWAARDDATAARAAEGLPPAERYEWALGRLAVQQLERVGPEREDGVVPVEIRPVTDRAERERAVAEAAGLAGRLPAEALRDQAAVVLASYPLQEQERWLTAHAGQADFDDLLIAQAGRGSLLPETADQRPSGEEALFWTSRIADPGLRQRMSQAAFRQLLAKNPRVAQRWVARRDAPADLVAAFQPLLGGQAP